MTKKIFIAFLILSIAPIIFIDSYFYFKSKKALIDRTFDQLTTLRIEKTNRLTNFFSQRFYFLENTATLQNIDSLFYYLNHNETKQTSQISQFKNSIRRSIGKNPPYNRIILIPQNNSLWNLKVNEDYRIDHFEGDKKESETLIKVLQKSIKSITPIIYDVKNELSARYHSIFMAYTITKGNQRTGTVILEISLNAINKIMYENNPHNALGKTVETYLVGDDYYMRSSSRFVHNSIFNITVNTVGSREAFQNIVGTKQIKDYRNVPVLSSFSKINIPQLNWVILAEIDTKEAMIPIHLIRNDIIYMSIILSVLLLALVEIFSSIITAPVKILKQETDKISKGETGSLVHAKSNDEIGDLIVAFNKMIVQLKEQTERLQYERILRTKSMFDGQEMERQRLSRELHDGLGQSILVLKMKFEQIGEATEQKKTKIIAEIEGLFVRIITEVRNISNDLMPAVLTEFGLVMALKKITREFNNNTGIKVEFENHSIHESFDKKIEVYIYRIVQEAFSNILKHAKATEIELSFLESEKNIELIIRDNGQGFILSEEILMKGNGISNIKERVVLLGGQVNILSEPAKGTSVYCKIPI